MISTTMSFLRRNLINSVICRTFSMSKPVQTFNKKSFEELLVRKMYVVPAFEIHNGPAGFFDYGPPSCALKANILAKWRTHFVVEENMLEMECTNITPSNVFEASGHVERFTDFMVRDVKTKECFRADKLLEDSIDAFLAANPKLTAEERDVHLRIQRQADAFNEEELHQMLLKYNVKSPSNKENDLTKPFPFNLMFKTTIGPEGTAVGFLRPETAQGLFVNFRRLLDYNQQKMPFAAAQIGMGFRNEISPRNGLLRVREFCMAEIEHFVHPDEKAKYVNFKKVENKTLALFSSDHQLGDGVIMKITIGEAVAKGIVKNETLGYFMARTQMYLESIGVDPERMRFRQHLPTEMAHYASDCWDMEVLLSVGWTECVGHADRACYDLTQHSLKTGVALQASTRLPEPIQVDKLVCEPNKGKIGPMFKKDQKLVINALEALDGDDLLTFQQEVTTNGRAVIPGTSFEVTSDLVSFQSMKKTVSEVKYTPSVVEPSFGVSRVITAVLEHAFSVRDNDEARCVMSFRPSVAPIKVGIYRLTNNNPAFDPVVDQIKGMLGAFNLVCRVDSSSGTIGRRYSRSDELGVPFGVTIDFQSLIDNSVTVRERDTMSQIRVPISELASLMNNLVAEVQDWQYVYKRYPQVQAVVEEEEEIVNDAKRKLNVADNAAPAKSIAIEHTFRASFSRPAKK